MIKVNKSEIKYRVREKSPIKQRGRLTNSASGRHGQTGTSGPRPSSHHPPPYLPCFATFNYESRSTKFCSLDLQKTLACLNFFNWHTRVIKRRFYFPRDINNYFLRPFPVFPKLTYLLTFFGPHNSFFTCVVYLLPNKTEMSIDDLIQRVCVWESICICLYITK